MSSLERSETDQEEIRQASTIPYHKPFRPFSSASPDEEGRNAGRLIRTSEAPPSAFAQNQNRMSTVSDTTNASRKVSARRPKVAPSFNIMVIPPLCLSRSII